MVFCRKWTTLIIILFIVTLMVPVPGFAGKTALERGQEITFLVPYSAGGGYDAYARLIAPFWTAEIKKETGVDVKIIVRNMPGAGGDIAYTKLNRTRPDNITVCIAQIQGALGFQMFRSAPYDVLKWTYIGQVQADSPGMIVRSDTKLFSFKEILTRSQKSPIVVGTAGYGDGTHMNPELLKNILARDNIKINFKYVHYKGYSKVRAALQRGEVEAAFGTTESFMTLYDEGKAHLVLVFDSKRKPFNPAVPTIMDYGLLHADEILDALIIPRAIVGPPNMKQPVIALLRKTFKSALEQETFRQKAFLAQRPLDYLSAEALKERIENKTAVFKKHEKLLKPLIGE